MKIAAVRSQSTVARSLGTADPIAAEATAVGERRTANTVVAAEGHSAEPTDSSRSSERSTAAVRCL